MRPAPAATDHAVTGWGSSALRRATLTLAIAQLVSWGVLFYGFAVTAPGDHRRHRLVRRRRLRCVRARPADRRASAHRRSPAPSPGSTRGWSSPPDRSSARSGCSAFAAAPNPVVLYLAWIVIGAAMAATLYEPAMAVLVALDPARRHRTLAVVTVAGGLAEHRLRSARRLARRDPRLAPGARRTRRRRRLRHRRAARRRAPASARPPDRRPR